MLNVKRLVVYIIFCSTLFFGLFLGENSSGGARFDHEYLLPFIEKFSSNFEKGLYFFINNSGSLIHSPIFYILASFFLKITNSVLFIKILNILISCLIPYIFYLILKTKYKTNSDYIFYFSMLIFLSPYFRSSAIWLLGDNLSLLFFSSSILFFLKIKYQKEKIHNYYLCFIFLILCCYVRYYYCIFVVYFLYHFYKNLNIVNLIKVLILGFFLSIPSFIYLFYVIKNFNFFGTLGSFGYINYYSTSLLILSIILFYLLPFIYLRKDMLISFYKDRPKKILVFFIPILLFYLIDEFYFSNLINFSSRGGGVFIKISEIVNFNSNIFLSIIAFISLLVIDFIFNNKKLENYSLLIILILCFPLFTIYQKYFDPLFFLFFFGLINSIYFKEIIIKNPIPLLLIYSYFFLFLLFSIFYYSIGA